MNSLAIEGQSPVLKDVVVKRPMLDPRSGPNGGLGVRTGESFRSSLQDGRSVWVGGHKVSDVTIEPGFHGAVETLAGLYDLQSSDARRDEMTTFDQDGVRISWSYACPQSKDELVAKRHNTEIISRQTLGFMGRFPDFCSNLLVALRDSAKAIGAYDEYFGSNAAAYFHYCSKNDLALTHALNDQFFDRKLKANKQPEPDLILRVVKETDSGIVVRGLKNLATLSPICDEAIVYPNRPRQEGEEDQAIAFAVQMNAPGLHIVCRDAYGAANQRRRLPLSTRFDEIDATLIFNDVHIPWERVFAYRQPELASRLIGMINPPWSSYVTIIRLISKLEAMAATTEMLCTYDGKDLFPNVQVRLGQMVRDIAVLKGCLRAMEEDGHLTEAGFYRPAASDAYRLFGVEASDRAELIMEDLAASALIPTASEEDFTIPGVGEQVQRYFKGLAPSSQDQVRLMALAADMTQSSFGSRTQLYERFHMGSPDVIYQRLLRMTDRSDWKMRVGEFMAAM